MKKKRRKSVGLLLGMLLVWCFSYTTQAEEESVSLIKMHAMDANECYIWDEDVTDSYGDTYNKGNIFAIDASEEGYVMYDLNGEYSRFSGKVIISNEASSECDIDMAIYGDGQELYSKKDITRQMEAQSFDIDVTGIGKLEIRTANVNGWAEKLFFVDSKFAKAKERTTPHSYTQLSDLTVVDSQDFSNGIYLQRDAFGALHKGGQFWGEMYQVEGYALYNLDQKYINFQGKFISFGEEASTDVQIYLDDNLAFEQKDMGRATPPVEVNLDVTNVKVMKVQITRHDKSIFLVDDILKSHEHTPGEWEVEKEATCAEKGKKVQRCTECKEVCNTQEIEVLEHTPGEWEVEKAPSCSGNGKKVRRCKVCNKVCDSETMEALKHTPGEWEIEKEATCEHDGEKVLRCIECDAICNKETIPRTDHEPGDWETDEEATCWSTGEESLYCKYCGKLLDYREIPMSDHLEEDEWIIQEEPSCTYEGTRIKRCEYCGETIKVEKIPKIKHKFSDWVKTDGSVWNGPIIKRRVCSRCYTEETKKVYIWIWVKPVVTILFLFGIVVAVLIVLMRQKGMEINQKNIKVTFERIIEKIKNRQKEEPSEDDIFNNQHRR